jgi:O-6-methylguanine DNA methyltransferase
MSLKRSRSSSSSLSSPSFSSSSFSFTPFRLLVYSMILHIPAGSYTTYSDLAAVIGQPTASRAVGNALRQNPFAPYVPCHRILSADRSLGGYSGAKDPNSLLLKKKQALLESEGVSFFLGRAGSDCLLDWSTIINKQKIDIYDENQLGRFVENAIKQEKLIEERQGKKTKIN